VKPAPYLVSDPATLLREPTADRPLLSANDWYGLGALFGITGEGHTKTMRRRVYCGKKGAYEQFILGARDTRREATC
jgi:hypothetical protein